jgi:hypothetical protein
VDGRLRTTIVLPMRRIIVPWHLQWQHTRRVRQRRRMVPSSMPFNPGFLIVLTMAMIDPKRVIAFSTTRINHALDIALADFGVLEYPGHTCKVHGWESKEEVDVELSGEAVGKSDLHVFEEGLDGEDGNGVFATRDQAIFSFQGIGFRLTASKPKETVTLERVDGDERFVVAVVSASVGPLVKDTKRRRCAGARFGGRSNILVGTRVDFWGFVQRGEVSERRAERWLAFASGAWSEACQGSC